MSRRADPRAGLSWDDLRTLAKLEGRPMPRGDALAAALGLSPAVAWKEVRELKRRGALAFVSVVQLHENALDCVTYLKLDWVHVNRLRPFDDWIADDPAIMMAAKVTGAFDYRLRSRHPDVRSANDWGRALLDRPEVSKMVTRFCTTVFDRSAYAAAILGTDPN